MVVLHAIVRLNPVSHGFRGMSLKLAAYMLLDHTSMNETRDQDPLEEIANTGRPVR